MTDYSKMSDKEINKHVAFALGCKEVMPDIFMDDNRRYEFDKPKKGVATNSISTLATTQRMHGRLSKPIASHYATDMKVTGKLKMNGVSLIFMLPAILSERQWSCF